MARVNIDIVGISELNGLEWVNLTQMTIISISILLQAGIPQKKWSSLHSQRKSLKCSTWVQSQKRQNDLCSFPRQTIQYHSNPSLCPDQ